MSDDSQARPGSVCLTAGVIFLGLTVARLVGGFELGPGRFWFELVNWTVGAALVMWGWSRLRRARAARADLTWWQFLHVEAVALGLILLLLPMWTVMTPEKRNDLGRSLMELVQLIHHVKGRP
jgi:hypothetical protein